MESSRTSVAVQNARGLTGPEGALALFALAEAQAQFAADMSLDRFVARVAELAVDIDPSGLNDYLDFLLRKDVDRNLIIDGLLPAVARHLGSQWFQNRMPWSDVSIGTGRLEQAAIGLAGYVPVATPLAQLLIVVPREEDHSFGATILADQLRRRSIAVTVAADLGSGQLGPVMTAQAPDLVAVSASSKSTLRVLPDYLSALRGTDDFTGPIFIGGGVTALDTPLPRFGFDAEITSLAEMADASIRAGLARKAPR
ncbi:MAG: hypothetical protein AAF631_10180 [Pseudomonadota bacterium]